MTRSVTAVLAIVLFTAAPAEANWWDWIHQLSGPGPSDSRGNALATICFGAADRGDARVLCPFIDVRRFVTRPEDNFPNRVEFEAFDFGVTWMLAKRRVELGAGAGFMRFHSEDRIADRGEITTTKLTFNAPRVVVVPLAFLAPDASLRPLRSGRARLLRLLKVYARLNVIPGTIDATDFGVPLGSGSGESTFSAKNDVVLSHGFIIDIGELFWD